MGSEPVNLVVEGDLDEVVLRRVLFYTGFPVGSVYGKMGKHYIHRRIQNYQQAARNGRWMVIVDLDSDFDCAPSLVSDWLPQGQADLMVRVAVRAIESWLLSDQERISSFLSVRLSSIPETPDLIPDPKQALVNLARRSTKREIREGLVPSHGSGRSIGKAYNSILTGFILGRENSWRPSKAMRSSESLIRCVRSLHRLREAH